MTYAKYLRIAVVGMGVLALGACAGHGQYGQHGQKETFGTIFGAAGGGLLGSKVGKGSGKLAATAVGVLVGAVIGNSIGSSLDRADRLYAARAEQHALEHLPVGASSEWSNPDSGHYGTVQPTSTYQDPGGAYCREYQHTVYVGGKAQQAYGRACRQPDGSWQVVNS